MSKRTGSANTQHSTTDALQPRFPLQPSKRGEGDKSLNVAKTILPRQQQAVQTKPTTGSAEIALREEDRFKVDIDDLEQRLREIHPLSEDLDLHYHHLLWSAEELQDLSMAQIAALQMIHAAALESLRQATQVHIRKQHELLVQERQALQLEFRRLKELQETSPP